MKTTGTAAIRRHKLLGWGTEKRSEQIVMCTYIDQKTGALVTVLRGPHKTPRRAMPTGLSFDTEAP